MPSNGSEQLRAIAAGCKAAGSRGLLNRTRGVIRVEARTVIEAARGQAQERLPKAGGLNQHIAAQKWTVQSLAGARTAGVRLKTRARGTQQADDGYIRHPTPRMYGYDRSYWEWVQQEIPQAKGWASDTVAHFGPALGAAIMRELDRAAAEIARAAGGS